MGALSRGGARERELDLGRRATTCSAPYTSKLARAFSTGGE